MPHLWNSTAEQDSLSHSIISTLNGRAERQPRRHVPYNRYTLRFPADDLVNPIVVIVTILPKQQLARTALT